MVKQKVVTFTVTKKFTIEKKKCLQCGKSFEGVKVAKFCTKNCANAASYRRNAEQYRAARRVKYREKASNE